MFRNTLVLAAALLAAAVALLEERPAEAVAWIRGFLDAGDEKR